MKRRYIVAALALVALLAIASPGIGLNLKKLVRKEVAKQIGKASGPPGAPETARAFGRVFRPDVAPCAPNCLVDRSKGVARVTQPFPDTFCIEAPGINSTDTVLVASVDANGGRPVANTSAQTVADAPDCPGGQFEVVTEEAAPADTDRVSFTFTIA